MRAPRGGTPCMSAKSPMQKERATNKQKDKYDLKTIILTNEVQNRKYLMRTPASRRVASWMIDGCVRL